ncbi:MAG: DUF3352 domain-containing protein [Planctomycetota bacterium]
MKNLKAVFSARKLLVMFCLAVLCALAGLSLSYGKPPDDQPPKQAGPADGKSVENPATGTPQAGINFDKFVPDNVYVYVSVNNIAKLCDTYKKSSFGKLWDDPEIKNFYEKAIALLQKEFTKNVTKETNIAFNDVTSLSEVFCGQAAFVLDRIELKKVKKQTKKPVLDENGQPVVDEKTQSIKFENAEVEAVEPFPYMVFMAEVTNNKEKLESLLEKITKSVAEEESALKKKEDYKGVSYFTFYQKKESTDFSYGYMDNIFFFSFGEKSLKRVIDAYKQPANAKALCTKPAYQKIAANADAAGLVTFYVNVPPLISIIKSLILKEGLNSESCTAEELDNRGKTVDKVIDASGLGELKSIVGSYRAEGNNFMFEGMVDMPVKKGILGILTGDPTSKFETIKAAPADTMMYMASTLSLPKLYDGVMDIMKSIMPPEQYENEVKAQIKASEEQLGLKIKDDILSVFGNEIAIIMNANKAASAPAMGLGASPFNMAFAIPIVKPEAVNNVHAQIIKLISEDTEDKSPFAEKKYGGFTFYVMEIPDQQIEGQPPLSEEARGIMGYFFTKDMFVFAMPAANLKSIADALSGKNSGSLAADPDFAKLTARNKVAEKSLLISYMNMEKYVANMLLMFDQLAKAGEVPELETNEDEENEDGADEGHKSPKPEVKEDEFAKLMKEMLKLNILKKYFIGCKQIQQIYPTSGGIMWRSFTQMGPD